VKQKTELYQHLTPVFIAIFPILSLAFENIIYVQFSSIIRSLLISMAAAYIFYLMIFLVIRNWHKAGILASLAIFFLLSYGNAYIFIEDRFGDSIKHRYLLVIFLLAFVLIGILVIFKLKNPGNTNTAIFFGGLVIVSYLLFSIGWNEVKQRRAGYISDEKTSENATVSESEKLPDIYLIILDGHTRSDVLKTVYDYDNSDFINELESMGFWVADCAQANYPGTNLSFSSLFEMDYLHNIFDNFNDLVLPPMNRTASIKILADSNYKIVKFDNYVMNHFDVKEDILFSRDDAIFGSINEFEAIVVDTSILRILIDMEGFFPDTWVRPFKDDIYLTHYRDSVFVLDKLPDIKKIEEPLFVYAHLLVTHDPFVFLPDGSYGSSKQGEKVDYRNAVEFIDTTLPEILNEIINESEEPPVIIVMGDHGATIKTGIIEDRMSILFALYLQGEKPEERSSYFSPVNAFRIIFNHLFNFQFDLIEDVGYPIWSISDLGNVSESINVGCEQ